MFFRATLFSAFGASKRWLGTNPDGSSRPLTTADFYKAGFVTGAAAAFTESPIDFYKSQIQVQMVRAKADPSYKGEFKRAGATGGQGRNDACLLALRGRRRVVAVGLSRCCCQAPTDTVYLSCTFPCSRNLVQPRTPA